MRSPSLALPRLTLVPLLALAAALAAGGCRSRCSSDADCVKSCPCPEKGGTQEERDTGQLCSMQLRCQNTFCETEESLLCGMPGDDFCSKYAKPGLCGSKKCDTNDDCVKTCTCATTVRYTAAAGQVAEDCCFREKVHGLCDEAAGACDTDYSRSCDDVCQAVANLEGWTCDDVCTHENTTRGSTVCTKRSCATSSGTILPTGG